MSDEVEMTPITPEEGGAEPPKVTPSAAMAASAPTVKLKPVIRKPLIRKPIIGGRNAYTTGIVTALLTAMRTKCSIVVDGEEISPGRILLCTIGNGQYVGGSFKCAPRAVPDDGLLEVCMFRTLNHIRFVQMLGTYTAGKHLDDPKVQKYLVYRRGKEIVVSGDKLMFSLDGELIETDQLKIDVLKGAVRFARP